MILLLDVDEVLADFHTPARDLIYELFGVRMNESQFKTWDINDSIPPEWKLGFQRGLAREGFAENLKPFPGAQEAVEKLRGICNEVLFVTSHNFESKTWMRERHDWLVRHFDAKHDEIFQVLRKQQVHGDILIDDKPKNLSLWHKSHPNGKALLWNRFHNQLAEYGWRVHNWDEVYEIIKSHPSHA